MTQQEIFAEQDKSVDKLLKVLALQKEVGWGLSVQMGRGDYPVSVESVLSSVSRMTGREDLKNRIEAALVEKKQ